MTSFSLKIIALITMLLDHIKYAIPITNNFITQYFGRISFPIFAFLITEGYIHTKSKEKYIKRLLAFAIISQIPFMLFRTLVSQKLVLNIIVTFLLAIFGIICLEFFKNKEELNKAFKYTIITICLCAIAILGAYINVDYSWFGICTVWIFYIFKKSKMFMCLGYIGILLIYYINIFFPNISNINWLSLIFSIIPIFIIIFYNGKEGKKVKYLFYIFYPLHMLILYGISKIL